MKHIYDYPISITKILHMLNEKLDHLKQTVKLYKYSLFLGYFVFLGQERHVKINIKSVILGMDMSALLDKKTM